MTLTLDIPPNVQLSQGDKIIALLSDKQWHLQSELMSVAGIETVRNLHTILTRLRNGGALIDSQPSGVGRAYEYKLRQDFKPQKLVRTGDGLPCPDSRRSKYKRNRFKEIVSKYGYSCASLERELKPQGISTWTVRQLWRHPEYIPVVSVSERLEELLPILKQEGWIVDVDSDLQSNQS